MSKSIALLFSGVLAVIVMVAGVYLVEGGSPVAYVAFAAAIAGFLWLFRKDQKRESRERIEASIAEDARYNELIAAAKTGDFELKVEGSLKAGWAVLMCLIGAGLIAYQMIILDVGGFSRILWALIGGILLLGGFQILFIALCAYGKPVIVLSTGGMETPLFGFTPWSFIEGICIQVIRIRSAESLQLELLVPNFRQLSGRFSWPTRWVYRVRPRSWMPVLIIPLYQTSEAPQVIYRTARWLWTESTGLSHDWNSLFSTEANAAIRQRSKAIPAIKKKDGGLRDPSFHSFETGALAQQVMHADVKIANEMRKIMRIRHWISAVSILVFAVYIFGKLTGV